MRVFVIGATGHTGTHILDLALSRGHQVTAFVRSPRKIDQKNARLTVKTGDPHNVDQLAAALPGHILPTISPRLKTFFAPATWIGPW